MGKRTNGGPQPNSPFTLSHFPNRWITELILLLISYWGSETGNPKSERDEQEQDGVRNQTPLYPHRLPLRLPHRLNPNPNSISMAPTILLSSLHERQWIEPNRRSLVRLAEWSKPKHHTAAAGKASVRPGMEQWHFLHLHIGFQPGV